MAKLTYRKTKDAYNLFDKISGFGYILKIKNNKLYLIEEYVL